MDTTNFIKWVSRTESHEFIYCLPIRVFFIREEICVHSWLKESVLFSAGGLIPPAIFETDSVKENG